MRELTFKQNQELKAFRKSKKKTYTVESSTKIITPWLRTLHPKFSLGDLGIKYGDKIIVSTLFGDNKLIINGTLSSDEETIYNHESITGNFNICNEQLMLEFDLIPSILYYTIISKKIYQPEGNCNC